MPVDYRHYGPEWDDIRAAVLAVGCCEFCGEVAPPGLAVCHLDGNPRNHHRANLKAGCKPCHLEHDEQQHRANAAATVAARRGVAVGIDWDRAVSALVDAGRLTETFGRGAVQLVTGLSHLRADAARQRVRKPGFYARLWDCDRGTVRARVAEILDAEWCEMDGVTALISRSVDLEQFSHTNDSNTVTLTGIHTNGGLYNTQITKITKTEAPLPDRFHLLPETIATLQAFQETAKQKRRVDLALDALQDYVEFHFVPQNEQHGVGSCNWQARLKTFLWGDLGTGQLWKRCGLDKPTATAEVAAVAARLRRDHVGRSAPLAPEPSRLAALIRRWEAWGRDPATVAGLRGIRERIPQRLAELAKSYKPPVPNNGPTIKSHRWDAALEVLGDRFGDDADLLRDRGRVVADDPGGDLVIALPDETHVAYCEENFTDELNYAGYPVRFVADSVTPPGFQLPTVYQHPDFEALARLELAEDGPIARKVRRERWRR